MLAAASMLALAAAAASRIDREPPPSPSKLSLATSPECLQTVSCAGRCGEQFVINAGVSCACDADCTLFNDCCRWDGKRICGEWSVSPAWINV